MSKPLIPTEILSALQAVIGSAAIYLINTGDRNLNLTISTLFTAIIAFCIEKIKTLNKLEEFVKLFSPIMSYWLSFKFKDKHLGNSDDPTDLSKAPECSPYRSFRYCVKFNNPAHISIYMWLPTILNCSQIESIDNKKTGYDRVKIKEAFKDAKYGFCLESNYKGLYEWEIVHYLPIYYSRKQKQYVYIRSCLSEDNHTRILYMFCEHPDPIDEITLIIRQWNYNQIVSATLSSSRLLFKVKFDGKKVVKDSRIVKKSFDSLFFEQKPILLEYLRKFKEGTLYPSHLGEDNKLGILMYGPPGTGKSACMCAMAEFLQRDLMPVDGASMSNIGFMTSIFQNTDVIIAFDEFDCLLDVVGKRNRMDDLENAELNSIQEKAKKEEKGSHSIKAEMAAKLFAAALDEKDAEKKSKMMSEYDSLIKKKDDKVDMAFLLSKFQGIESADGRFIVASTNAPHLIDDALKRKGRFDLVLHLDNATPQMILDIVTYYFQSEEAEKLALTEEFASHLPIRVISPAMVQDIAINSSSARDAIQKMISTDA